MFEGRSGTPSFIFPSYYRHLAKMVLGYAFKSRGIIKVAILLYCHIQSTGMDTGALSTRIHFHLKIKLFLYGYGFRPHVSNKNDQRRRNFSKTLSRVELFENAVLRERVNRRKGTDCSKTPRTHYQFQSTSRNIRNLFKTANGRFPFLSFILGWAYF